MTTAQIRHRNYKAFAASQPPMTDDEAYSVFSGMTDEDDDSGTQSSRDLASDRDADTRMMALAWSERSFSTL